MAEKEEARLQWVKEKLERCVWTVVPEILAAYVWSGVWVWVWGAECSLSVHMWACWVPGGRAMSLSARGVTWTLSAEKVTDGTGSRGGGGGWSQWDSREMIQVGMGLVGRLAAPAEEWPAYY